MAIPDTSGKWPASINRVTIGATAEQGGSRRKTVTVGGARCIPGAAYEGDPGEPAAVAAEVWDTAPDNWPRELVSQWGDVFEDTAAWARKAAHIGADLICLKLQGTHPDGADRSPDDAVATVKSVLEAVGVPLIVWGCGVAEKDNQVLPRCAAATHGENLLFGTITEKNYRTLIASCMADGHKLIGEAPCDINMSKQVNILAQDAGYPLENLVMWPTTAALGYGFEFVYSIQERARLAGLGGDQLLRQPIICDVGAEAWRTKEARAGDEEVPDIGPAERRGPLWEAATAANLLQAGCDILVMRHPKAIAQVRQAVGWMAPDAATTAVA